MKIPFNRPHLTGKETEYIHQAVNSGKISGNGDFTKKCHNFFEEKYGFNKTDTPEIKISFELKNKLTMNYHDNGTWFDNPETDNFGTSLIEIFTEQLEGSFVLNKHESGTEYIFEFDLLD